MSTTPTDYYVSAYSGEEIDAAIAAMDNLSGVNVRADVAQDLTTEQQAQARSNIRAAPGIESTDYPGCYYNVLTGGVVEWINPPMVLGTEYRTAERYLGSPVYTKLIDCGALPTDAVKRKTVAHGADAQYMLRCVANGTAGAYLDSLPYWYSPDDYCMVYASTTQIIFYTEKDLSARNANAQIWYTKNTG